VYRGRILSTLLRYSTVLHVPLRVPASPSCVTQTLLEDFAVFATQTRKTGWRALRTLVTNTWTCTFGVVRHSERFRLNSHKALLPALGVFRYCSRTGTRAVQPYFTRARAAGVLLPACRLFAAGRVPSPISRDITTGA